MSSILPKGIVVNTPEISSDIQKIDREPLALDEIAKFWKVYTTTKRRLVDPTAERLENFWWRIWGSRKRNLKGAMVARIFADISDERSFVPLRGPLNRDESGGRPTTPLTLGLGMTGRTAVQGRQESDSSNGRQSSSLSRSATAMPPPILKKSRGPSSTGPRPTARFISPHTSEEEVASADPPVSGPGAQVIVRPPTPPNPVSPRTRDEQKAETSGRLKKKGRDFVAAASASNRKPHISRRPSSGPAARTQQMDSNLVDKDLCENLPEKNKKSPDSGASQNQLDVHENASPLPETLLPVNTPKKTRSGTSGSSKLSSRRSSTPKHGRGQGSAMSLTARGLGDRGEIPDRLQQPEKEYGYVDKSLTASNESQPKAPENLVSDWGLQQRSAVSHQPLAPRTSSTTMPVEKVDQHHASERRLPKNLGGKSSISVEPTYTAVAGETLQPEKQGPGATEHQGSSTIDGGAERSSRRQEQSPLFAKRPVQPPKSASALFASATHQSSGSMSRSKSQLTLLLERDRAREKENRDRI